MAGSDTRERILQAALDSFLADGYERTTVAHIREGSGVSNGALFHHFASKEAVAEALFVKGIASFQEGLWELLAQRPRTLRAAVGGTIEHQLRWVEAHTDLARFVYARGHLDWSSPGGAEVTQLNETLGAAFEAWLEPLRTRGEIRVGSMLMLSAIVNGPAHAIARRWLAGHLDARPLDYARELTDAACAGLSGTPVTDGAPVITGNAPAPRHGRLTVELIDERGDISARGHAVAELVAVGAAGARKHPKERTT
jgi:AcrR family transcriptional regulator